jgi:hypothetical protein
MWSAPIQAIPGVTERFFHNIFIETKSGRRRQGA